MAKVQYTGASDIRQISKKDWDSIGINHDTVTWEKLSTDHRPVVDFGPGDLPEAVELYFAEDPDFKVYADDAVIPRSGIAAKAQSDRRMREAAARDAMEPGANTGGLAGGSTGTAGAATGAATGGAAGAGAQAGGGATP